MIELLEVAVDEMTDANKIKWQVGMIKTNNVQK